MACKIQKRRNLFLKGCSLQNCYMINILYLKLLVSLVLVLISTACTPVKTTSLADLTFKHLQPISLKVSNILVVSKASPVEKGATIHHKLHITPHDALKTWAKDRLRSIGHRRTARFTILDAKIIETNVKNRGDFADLFKLQASEKYDVSVKAKIEIIDISGLPIATAVAAADWSQSVREDVSLIERQQVWFNITEKTLNQFNKEMEDAMQLYMAEHLR